MVITADKDQPVTKIPGKMITFYSYKGGVGRSMALANVAALLAKWGKEVLIIDWDLEAPGLENFYRKYLTVQQVAGKEGIIDLLSLSDNNWDSPSQAIDWNRYITRMEGDLSHLSIMTSGRKDENYVPKVRAFNASKFFDEKDGGKYLEQLRTAWIEKFDFVFIDSRTGLTDSSGICSIHMPDVLVLLFTPNEQSFRGSIDVGNKAAAAHARLIYDRLKLKLFPIPTRIENNESARREEWLDRFATDLVPLFNWLPRKMPDTTQFSITPKEVINQTKVPYLAEYAYGEQLPAMEKGTDDPQDIGWIYETIAAIICNHFDNLDFLKNSRDQYIKKAKGEEITDHVDFERKIAIEKEEKSKLIESINRQTAEYKKRRYRLLIAGLGVLVLAVIGYFYFSRNSSVIPPDEKDKVAYEFFVSEFTKGPSNIRNSNGPGSYSTLDLLTFYNNYFKLSPEYREKGANYKKILDSSMQEVLGRQVQTLYRSFDNSDYLLSLFADTLTRFDSVKNVASKTIFGNATYLRNLALQQKKSLGNSPSAVPIGLLSFKSDSAGFNLEYSEKSYSLFPRRAGSPGTLAEISFNYDLKITTVAPVTMAVQLITPPLVDSARLFLLSGTKDSTVFQPLTTDFASAGFSLVRFKYLFDLGRPDKPEIRYFNIEDSAQAAKIAAYMQAKLGNSRFPANKYTDPTTRPGYIEIWLGR